MRLDKYLCEKAYGTRSTVRDIVRAGRVLVNGQVLRDPAAHIAPGRDLVAVDGQTVDGRTEYHVMLHKPQGVLTAARDKKQPTVMDLLPPLYRAAQCMPIGRLDKDTTGLLIFTTDGQLNHRLLSPKRHVDKVYLATLRDALKADDIAAFAAGLPLSDFIALPATLAIISSHSARVTVREGKFHQIKRMFEAVGNEVTALHRESFGGITLDPALLQGTFRDLTREEVTHLLAQTEKGNDSDE